MNGKRTPNRNQVFDSNGPGIRVRGNAQQLVEKYLSLARDAASQGDRVLAENHNQHADHYQRVLNALTGRYNRPDDAQQPAQNAAQVSESDEDPAEADQPVLGGLGPQPTVTLDATAEAEPQEAGQAEAEEAPPPPRPTRRRRSPRATAAASGSGEGQASGGEDQAPAAESIPA